MASCMFICLFPVRMIAPVLLSAWLGTYVWVPTRVTQVVVISGETGCGKTTQVPQFVLDSAAGRGG
eukprot:3823620-Pyramimonas_sp.AAC.1